MNLKTLYYRGFLQSCNYNCPYCPFRKKELSEESRSVPELVYDREALEKFTEKAPSLGKNISVIIVPYGEAMIHFYYFEALKKLCMANTVIKVGIQSNVSFSVAGFLEYMKGADLSKLRLWCTFHPYRAALGEFLEKCHCLYQNKIRFSVGAVGIPKNIKLFAELRRRLPPDLYLWINAAEGMGRKYTQEEINEFISIDPLFTYELENHTAQPDLCTGGKESVFIEATGDVFACPISKKKLGNIYAEQIIPPVHSQVVRNPKTCLAKNCHCYLAYSLRKDIFNVPGFEEECRIF